MGNKTFRISPEQKKKIVTADLPDYDKLIAIEERKLERAKSAYLAEIDTIEQYAANKKEIETRITELLNLKNAKDEQPERNLDEFAKRVETVIEFIENKETSAEAKNDAIRTIVEKVVYEKAKQNIAIYFLDS